MNHPIEVLHESVDTPAGWRTMPLTAMEWYCAGIGLGRLARSGPARSALLAAGKCTPEPTSWQ